MLKTITYKEALAKLQKGFDNKSIERSNKCIDFMKGLLIRTFEDRLSNALTTLKTANGFYFRDPKSESTKKLMKAQKEEIEELDNFLDSLRDMKKSLNNINVIEHYIQNNDVAFHSLYFENKA